MDGIDITLLEAQLRGLVSRDADGRYYEADRCAFCSFDPTNANDYCDRHSRRWARMTYTRYAIVAQADSRIVEWCGLRRWANDAALRHQRKTGGIYFIARIVAYTDASIKENVKRRKPAY